MVRYDTGAGGVCRGRYSAVKYRNVLMTNTTQCTCLGIDIELNFEFDQNMAHNRWRVGRDAHEN